MMKTYTTMKEEEGDGDETTTNHSRNKLSTWTLNKRDNESEVELNQQLYMA